MALLLASKICVPVSKIHGEASAFPFSASHVKNVKVTKKTAGAHFHLLSSFVFVSTSSWCQLVVVKENGFPLKGDCCTRTRYPQQYPLCQSCKNVKVTKKTMGAPLHALLRIYFLNNLYHNTYPLAKPMPVLWVGVFTGKGSEKNHVYNV